MNDAIFTFLVGSAVGLIVLMILLLTSDSNDLDNTCPSYGEVQVVIDGGETLCVPWEKVADFDQFKGD